MVVAGVSGGMILWGGAGIWPSRPGEGAARPRKRLAGSIFAPAGTGVSGKKFYRLPPEIMYHQGDGIRQEIVKVEEK